MSVTREELYEAVWAAPTVVATRFEVSVNYLARVCHHLNVRGKKIASHERPARHPLVSAVREFFEAGRLSEVGYLRPRKRNLVDLFVSKETLVNALNLANA